MGRPALAASPVSVHHVPQRGRGDYGVAPELVAWAAHHWLAERTKFGQHYADKAEETGGMTARVINKRGTPTMGGILIVLAMDLSALLWAQWNELVLLTLLSVIVLAGLGFYDDYAKITQQSNLGAKSHVKLGVQTVLALFIALYLWKLPSTTKLVTEIMVPFYKYPVLTGATGIGIVLITAHDRGQLQRGESDGWSRWTGHRLHAHRLACFSGPDLCRGQLPYRKLSAGAVCPGAGELTVFCAAMIGAGLGFLWFNCHPAQVFMGDTGSLALGGALGIIAVLIHQPFMLVIAGGVFVAEAVSVIIQTTCFKYTKRRYGAAGVFF